MPPFTVLVVEDIPLVALDIEEQLRAFGVHSVVTARCFYAARQALAAERFRLAIIDLSLAPAGFGLGVDLRAALGAPTLPIVALSTGTDSDSELMIAPPSTRLMKPFFPDAFKQAVEAALRDAPAPTDPELPSAAE